MCDAAPTFRFGFEAAARARPCRCLTYPKRTPPGFTSDVQADLGVHLGSRRRARGVWIPLPYHPRFQSESLPASTKPLHASYGPRGEEPRHRPSTGAAEGEISESPDMGRALTKRVKNFDARFGISLLAGIIQTRDEKEEDRGFYRHGVFLLLRPRSPAGVLSLAYRGRGCYRRPKVHPNHGVFLPLADPVTPAIPRRCRLQLSS